MYQFYQEQKMDCSLINADKQLYELVNYRQNHYWAVYFKIIMTVYFSNIFTSERGVRKIKIKQKVSGCFRTDSGADDFAKLHSIAETAMKNGNSKFNAILAVVQ